MKKSIIPFLVPNRLQKQINHTLSILILGALTFAAGKSSAEIAQGTSSPDQFGFSSDTYYVDEDATNAIITVDFTPGNSSFSGSVNYSVSNGTATAGADYKSVSGTLSFSGPGTPIPVITIPISKDRLPEGNETIELYLSNPNAVLIRSHATLIIVNKNEVPSLGISPTANGGILLSWSTNYSDFSLEKKAGLAGTWGLVTAARSISNNSCHVTEPCTGQPIFYRLKKTSSP
jgi:hypothetical protein